MEEIAPHSNPCNSFKKKYFFIEMPFSLAKILDCSMTEIPPNPREKPLKNRLELVEKTELSEKIFTAFVTSQSIIIGYEIQMLFMCCWV